MMIAAPALRDRLLALLALSAPVGVGVVAFVLGGAPSSFAAINLVGLLIAWALLLVPQFARPNALAVVVGAAIALLAASLLLGPELEGVRRWIAVGPIRLHAGMLVIPALAAALPRLRQPVATAITVTCAILIWLQPDLASAAALCLGSICSWAGSRRTGSNLTLPLIAALGLAATSLRADPLSSVKFVETALSDGWNLSPILGAALAISLVAGLILPPWLAARNILQLRLPALGIFGAMVGFAAVSVIKPYPQPLIGFGASAIIGYGLALAVLRQLR